MEMFTDYEKCFSGTRKKQVVILLPVLTGWMKYVFFD